MALWQFDLIFVRNGAASPTPDQEGSLNVSPLPIQAVGLAKEWLSKSLGKPVCWCDDIYVFGAEDGCRVDLLVLEDGSAELSCRIDARVECHSFADQICKLAQLTDCSLFSTELGATVQSSAAELVLALAHSRANRYVQDPSGTLRKLSAERDASDSDK